MLRITDGKGFQLEFNNGWNISVQFGPANYCQRRREVDAAQDAMLHAQGKAANSESPNAEVLIWHNSDPTATEGEGWCPADLVAAKIAVVQAREPK